MNTYIISYDLHTPGQNYENLIKKIKNYPTWAKVTLSTFIIETPDTAVTIRDNLQSTLDSNDKLFVWTIKAPSAWYWLWDEVWKWLLWRLK